MMNSEDYKLVYSAFLFLLVALAIAVLYFAWKTLQGQRVRRLPLRGLRRQNAIRCSSALNSTISCGSTSSSSLLFPPDLQLRFISPPPAYEGTYDPPPKYEEVVDNQNLSNGNQQPIERI